MEAPAAAAEQVTLNAILTVNDNKVESAQSIDTAIPIHDLAVEFKWLINNKSAKPIHIDEARVTYSPFLPPLKIDVNATVPKGIPIRQTMSLGIPEWALSLNMPSQITIQLYSLQNGVVFSKSFWVFVGLGSPLTGLVGGGAIGLTVFALAFAFGALARAANARNELGMLITTQPGGESLRYLAGGCAGIATLFWIVYSGVALPGEPYVSPLYVLLLSGSIMAALVKVTLTAGGRAIVKYNL